MQPELFLILTWIELEGEFLGFEENGFIYYLDSHFCLFKLHKLESAND